MSKTKPNKLFSVPVQGPDKFVKVIARHAKGAKTIAHENGYKFNKRFQIAEIDAIASDEAINHSIITPAGSGPVEFELR